MAYGKSDEVFTKKKVLDAKFNGVKPEHKTEINDPKHCH